MVDSKSINVSGDILTVHWNGNVWVSPSNGQQHSSARAALAVELRKYESECGIDEDEMTDIDDYELMDGE